MKTVAGIAVGMFLSAALMGAAHADRPSYLDTVIKAGPLKPNEIAKLSKRNQAMLKMANAAQTKRELVKQAHDNKNH